MRGLKKSPTSIGHVGVKRKREALAKATANRRKENCGKTCFSCKARRLETNKKTARRARGFLLRNV